MDLTLIIVIIIIIIIIIITIVIIIIFEGGVNQKKIQQFQYLNLFYEKV